MKKRLAVILILCVAVGSAVALTACTVKRPNKHMHVASRYEITRAATCTEDGERTGVCTICNKAFAETIAATGHDWLLQDKEEATCTESGSETYTCANCSATETRTVAALGHDGAVVIAAVPAGCESVGRTEGRNCSRCGFATVAVQEIPAKGHALYYSKRGNDTHAVLCENCSFSQIEACAVTEVEAEPTCTAAGRLSHICTVCGDEHAHETAAALGHLLTAKKTFYTTAEGAYKHRQTCYRCDYYEDENCGRTVQSVVAATCETIGYTAYACDGCGHTYSADFIDALGHDWSAYTLYENSDDPYAHTHERHCRRQTCTAEERGVPVGTVGAVLSLRTDETCERDAFTEYACSLATCSYARKETHAGTALGHSFDAWKYSGDGVRHTHTHFCLRTACEKVETAACRMTTSGQAATCTEPSIEVTVCADCLHMDRIDGPALGHSWSAWNSVRNMDGSTTEHTHVCNVCKLREYGKHSYETTTTPADCERDETASTVCSMCGHTASIVVLGTALGHEWTVVYSDEYIHRLVCNRYETPHEKTAPHDHVESNLCADCGYDGLTYALSPSGDFFTVQSDNAVPYAREIVVALSRPNPAFTDGGNAPETLPVRIVRAWAFARNSSVATVRLPACVTEIEEHAFEDCANLGAVSFYGGDPQLTVIAYSAFYACSSLTVVELPATLRVIGNIAFSGCVRLDHVTIPESVTEIGINALRNTAFYNNAAHWTDGALYAGRHLIRVDPAFFTTENDAFTIKSGTRTVSANAFEGCENMRCVTIPVSVTTVGNDAFKGCTGLEAVTYDGSTLDWFAITFVSTLSSPMYYATRMSLLGETSADLVLPQNITSIPAGTFKGNTVITKVTIPALLTSIGDEAFRGCVNLRQIVFTDDLVSYIGRDAFLDTAYYNDASHWEGGVLFLGKHILATNGDFIASDYTIANDIRTVSEGAFAARALTHLTVGESVVWMGAGAFNAALLESVTFERPATWLARSSADIVRAVTVTDNATANATLLKNYVGEWRRL